MNGKESEMQFFMAMQPPTATHQEKAVRVIRTRTGQVRPQVYEPERVAAARAKLCAALNAHRPPHRLQGPLRLVVKWCFPRGKHPDGSWRTTRPDTDNLNKLLKDCMTAEGFWEDDAQVVSEVCEKFWAETSGIWVRLDELGDGKG